MSRADRGGPVAERVAAVFCGGRQGSGYLLSPFIVLTAAHLVGDGIGGIRAVVPGGRGPKRCVVVWERQVPGCDVALLLADEPLTAYDRDVPWERTDWGKVPSPKPVKDCQAIGYPYAQRNAHGRLESEQLIGTLKPGSGLLSGRCVLDSDHGPPVRRADGGSPWAGFSGAALFAYGLLVGVAEADAGGWQHTRITATPVGELLGDLSFFSALKRHGCPIPVLRTAHPDAEFERRYADYIATQHSELTIYGIDPNHDGAWPLDASYLSLEATLVHGDDEESRGRPLGGPGALGGMSRPGGPGGPGVPAGMGRPGGPGALSGPGRPGVPDQPGAWQRRTPLPADQALSGRDRVLLRGVAGSGKTTLVQWLAVTAARGEATGDLAYLKGRVPFVLPLRTIVSAGGDLPAPERFLSAVDCPIASAQPDGRWADRVLSEGRGLLLVDGIDEIPEQHRERTRRWLHNLIAAYSENLWLVTSRPSAVRDNWLARDSFTELALAPMSRDEVTAFVKRWHAATGADASLESGLLTAVRTKQDLARLATNPLMCALICALHRNRRGYLPDGRKELYDAALSMLLERRDQEKGIPDAFGVQLTMEPQIRLLQKLAHWMLRNQRAELDRARAERIIADALPSVPQVAKLGKADKILHHLLLRSGLLREPALDAIDFVHRTFQDFLAAKAVVDEGDFDMLLNNAAKTQWEDVIRMAVGHARPGERKLFLKGLIDLGDRNGDRRMHLLAMACLELAAELDYQVRKEVEDRASRLIPPRSFEEAAALIEVGPMVLELLPGPENLTEWEAGYVLETAAGIAHDAALPLLARFCGSPWPRVRERVVDAWGSFDATRYAQEVISHFPTEDVLTVRNPEQMAALGGLGGRPRLQVRGDFPGAALAPSLARDALDRTQDLLISTNRSITGLGFLKSWRRVRRLVLSNCPNITSVDGLDLLPDLEYFSADLSRLPECTRFLPPRAPLRELSLPHAVSPHGWLQGIDHWPALRSLELGPGNSPSTAAGWQAIGRLPALEHLKTAATSLSCIPPQEAAVGLQRLALVGDLPYDLPADRIFAMISRYFPSLSVLDLSGLKKTRGWTINVPLLARPPELNQLIVPRGMVTGLTGLDRVSGPTVVEVS